MSNVRTNIENVVSPSVQPWTLTNVYAVVTSEVADVLGPARTGEDRVPIAPPVDITQLYTTQRLPLVRLAILLVDDLPSAEDVVQDAFMALHKRQYALRSPDAAVAYLRTSVINGCRSALRRRRVRRRHPDAELPPAGSAVDERLLAAEEHERVLAAVRTLPRRQREVLILRYWSDLSEADIAASLGVAVGTVKSNASRGLARLENLLGDDR
jgi:RNA polymerase sigma-70 factor (sigma-E family)